MQFRSLRSHKKHAISCKILVLIMLSSHHPPKNPQNNKLGTVFDTAETAPPLSSQSLSSNCVATLPLGLFHDSKPRIDLTLCHGLGGRPLPLPDGPRSKAKPSGIGSGKGNGLAGLAIMVMAKVWLTWVLVALSLPGGGRVRGLELDGGAAWLAELAALLLGGTLSGGGSAPLGARGNAELPGRGFDEFDR